MKRLLKAYSSFTRTERMGLVGLSVLLAGLVAFRASMHLWVRPEFENKKELLAAYREQNDVSLKISPKRQQSETTKRSDLIASAEKNIETAITGESETGQSAKSVRSEVQTFDPNTADSPTLRRFGLRPVTIANLLKWRAKGKRFYAKEDIKPLYTLTNEEYNMLEPYIIIKQLKVDLNTADSATLVGLRGIGPKTAHKIIVYRRTIGPFTSHDQLKELYDFPDGVFERLKREVVIRE